MCMLKRVVSLLLAASLFCILAGGCAGAEATDTYQALVDK